MRKYELSVPGYTAVFNPCSELTFESFKNRFFDSIIETYPRFLDWVRTCCNDRDSLCILDPEERVVGFCIYGVKPTTKYEMSGKVVKVCSLKVDDLDSKKGFGSFFIQKIIEMTNPDWLYATTYPDKVDMWKFLESKGFERYPTLKYTGEYVYRLRVNHVET